MPFAVVAAIMWIVLGVVVARSFAIGGWTSPILPLGSLLAIPAMTLAWVLVGNHPRRTTIAAAAMIAGLVAIPVASTGATPSTGRLASIANDIDLPGTIERDVRIGDGRCRPVCSELRRTSVVGGIAFVKARTQVRAALVGHGYSVRVYAHAAGAPQRIDAAKGKILVSLELRLLSDGRTRIAAVFLAQGPAPDTSVG